MEFDEWEDEIKIENNRKESINKEKKEFKKKKKSYGALNVNKFFFNVLRMFIYFGNDFLNSIPSIQVVMSLLLLLEEEQILHLKQCRICTQR
jgi:hypothetical protein